MGLADDRLRRYHEAAKDARAYQLTENFGTMRLSQLTEEDLLRRAEGLEQAARHARRAALVASERGTLTPGEAVMVP